MAKTNFVTMKKDGETIDVSPLTVKAHEDIGWKVVDAPVEAPEEPQPKNKQPKRSSQKNKPVE